MKAEKVTFTKDMMRVFLSDGRELAVPLAWFPRLLHADRADLEKVRLSATGLHWIDLDEDIGIAGLLKGQADRSVASREVAA